MLESLEDETRRKKKKENFGTTFNRETFRRERTRTKTKTTSIPFTNIFFAVNATSNPTRASPRLDSTRKWRGGQKSAKRTGVVRKWVKMTSATRTRTERLSNREVIFARDGRGRLSMLPFLLFFFFFHSSSRNTNTGICNKYIYIYARTKLVRKRIDGKTNLQGD